MDNYIVIKSLSSGSFGDVLKVKNRYTDKILAVKVEPHDFGHLAYEAKIYNCLSGLDCVPKIRSYKTDGENAYLFMDLMDYDLKRFKIERSQDSDYINQVNRVIVALIIILKSIHSRNILHRDIKPENICFQADRVKLIDFGLAKLRDNNNDEPVPKNIIGTPNYVSLYVINGLTPDIYDELESLCYIYIYLILDIETLSKYFSLENIDKKNPDIITRFINNVNITKQINLHLKVCRDFKTNTNSLKNEDLYKYLERIYNLSPIKE